MEKIMAVLVRESDYARELAGFLSAREEFPYKPIAFSDIDAYLNFERENAVELLLCDRDMEPGERQRSPGKVCILSEYSTVAEDSEGRSSVFKYQSSDRLMKDIMACVDTDEKERRGLRHPAYDSSTECTAAALPVSEPVECGFRTVGVCSPLGGTRCSVYSFALAEYFSGKEKTLFVSLDPFFKVSRSVDTGGRDISELLYFLETQGYEGEPLPAEYIRADGGADVIKGPSHWLDLENLGKDSLVRLKELAERSGYKCVVFDLGRPQTAAVELLRNCTDIYVTRRKGRHDDEAIAEWKRQLRLSGLSGIAEKFKERTVPDDKAAEGAIDRNTMLRGSLGGYIRETEEFGYFG